MKATEPVVRYVLDEFTRLANAQKAVEMAAYMKTTMPFYGIQKPDRIPVYKEIARLFRPQSRKEYERNVKALWSQTHREVKYAALGYAGKFSEFVSFESMPLFEQLVREGAWWDLVDDIAINLIGDVLLKDRSTVTPLIKQYVRDDDMWIRRTSLICHNHHKKQTDQKLLLATCVKLAAEREFFIRKAIGWALREYSSANPAAVMKFLDDNKTILSPLSFREGAKYLIRKGYIQS